MSMQPMILDCEIGLNRNCQPTLVPVTRALRQNAGNSSSDFLKKLYLKCAGETLPPAFMAECPGIIRHQLVGHLAA